MAVGCWRLLQFPQPHQQDLMLTETIFHLTSVNIQSYKHQKTGNMCSTSLEFICLRLKIQNIQVFVQNAYILCYIFFSNIIYVDSLLSLWLLTSNISYLSIVQNLIFCIKLSFINGMAKVSISASMYQALEVGYIFLCATKICCLESSVVPFPIHS